MAFNRYRNNSSNLELKRHLKFLQENLNNSTESSEQRCCSRIANILNNTQKNSRSYWSLMKISLNNKKIPLISPLYHENRFITDFKEKAELFNSFFSKKCSLLANYGELSTSLSFQTDKRLSSVIFSAEDIRKIIQGLDHSKAHGHDNISIRMFKTCGDNKLSTFSRGGSRAAKTSKMECFVIIITKHSILDVAAALDPLLFRDET